MIRVYKSPDVPKSLFEKKSWRGDDVSSQLAADQHGKCYLCERSLLVEYQVEHHKSQANHPHLQYEWTNLLLGCGYCNGKKSDRYDNILNPVECNVEELIYQNIDFPNASVLFQSMTSKEDVSVNSTIELLDKIFNGKKKLRNFKEQRLYDAVVQSINTFQGYIGVWLKKRDVDSRETILKELDKTSEFLGFKFWIIKSNETLLAEFGDHIIWNKASSFTE
jgi:bacteriophage lambda ninG protein